jgi:hypothetical protein
VSPGSPRGVLCVPCEKFVPSLALKAYLQLQLPIGSQRAFVTELTTPAAKRNACIHTVLSDPQAPAWIYFGDSDMVPEPDTVLRLLETGHDVVGALYAGRMRGHPPLANGDIQYGLECGYADGREHRWEDVCGTLAACDWVGAGALLVRRRVLEALAPGAWFTSDETGENEDMEFCAKARAAGFPIYVEGRVRVAHLQLTGVLPQSDDASLAASSTLTTI